MGVVNSKLLVVVVTVEVTTILAGVVSFQVVLSVVIVGDFEVVASDSGVSEVVLISAVASAVVLFKSS